MKTIRTCSALILGVLWFGVVGATANPVFENFTDNKECPGEKSSCEVTEERKEFDFSDYAIGQYTEFAGYDARGNEFTYRVTRVHGGIDVAVKTRTISKVDRNTTIVFKGPKGVVKSVRLADQSSQRCGLICVLAHICCIKIHLGPPGNTWEWDCECTYSNE